MFYWALVLIGTIRGGSIVHSYIEKITILTVFIPLVLVI